MERIRPVLSEELLQPITVQNYSQRGVIQWQVERSSLIKRRDELTFI